MRKLFQTLMRNIKIFFDEKESKVIYKEYFFNEISFPKDIEFNDIDVHSLKVNWKMDNINLLNIDKKKIKFKVEMRKENSEENFTKIYEGNKLKYFIKNLDRNTYYEFRI